MWQQLRLRQFHGAACHFEKRGSATTKQMASLRYDNVATDAMTAPANAQSLNFEFHYKNNNNYLVRIYIYIYICVAVFGFADLAANLC